MTLNEHFRSSFCKCSFCGLASLLMFSLRSDPLPLTAGSGANVNVIFWSEWTCYGVKNIKIPPLHIKSLVWTRTVKKTEGFLDQILTRSHSAFEEKQKRPVKPKRLTARAKRSQEANKEQQKQKGLSFNSARSEMLEQCVEKSICKCFSTLYCRNVS